MIAPASPIIKRSSSKARSAASVSASMASISATTAALVSGSTRSSITKNP